LCIDDFFLRKNHLYTKLFIDCKGSLDFPIIFGYATFVNKIATKFVYKIEEKHGSLCICLASLQQTRQFLGGSGCIMALTDDECYVRLREAIMKEELLPNERLIEMDLAQSLGAGRAAIRTALARLEQEGLVQRERYRGARVRLISEAEAIEILEVRAALESLAVRYAALNATPEDSDILWTLLAEQRHCIDEGDLLRSSEVNAQLHQTLLHMSHHVTASRLLDMLKPQNVRFQYRTILVPGRPERSHQEHSAIVEAVTSHDPDRAEAAMRLHLSHVAEALRQARKTRQAEQRED
jgi:DNA-binding GntR family transcriptional regulator